MGVGVLVIRLLLDHSVKRLEQIIVAVRRDPLWIV